MNTSSSIAFPRDFLNPLIGAFVAVVVRAGADLGAVTLRTPSFDNEDTIGEKQNNFFI